MNDLIVVEKIAGWEKTERAGARQRLLADYKTRLQYGAGRVPAWWRAKLDQEHD
jgi:hypothetical protein